MLHFIHSSWNLPNISSRYLSKHRERGTNTTRFSPETTLPINAGPSYQMFCWGLMRRTGCLTLRMQQLKTPVKYKLEGEWRGTWSQYCTWSVWYNSGTYLDLNHLSSLLLVRLFCERGLYFLLNLHNHPEITSPVWGSSDLSMPFKFLGIFVLLSKGSKLFWLTENNTRTWGKPFY